MNKLRGDSQIECNGVGRFLTKVFVLRYEMTNLVILPWRKVFQIPFLAFTSVLFYWLAVHQPPFLDTAFALNPCAPLTIKFLRRMSEESRRTGAHPAAEVSQKFSMMWFPLASFERR